MERIENLIAHFIDAVPTSSSSSSSVSDDLITAAKIPKGLPGYYALETSSKTGIHYEYFMKGQSHRLYHQWALQYGTIYGYYLFRSRSFAGRGAGHHYLRVVVTDPAEARKILVQNPAKSSLLQLSVLIGEGIIGNNDKEEWHQQRGWLKPAVTSDNIQNRMFPVILDQVTRLVATFNTLGFDPQTHSPRALEAHQTLLLFAFGVIGSVLLGEEPDFLKDRLPVLNRAFCIAVEKETFGSNIEGASILQDPEYLWANERIDEFVNESVGRYKSNNGCPRHNSTAFISLILASDQQGKPLMTEKIQRDQITSFLIAGHETSAHTMSWMIMELARNPGIQRKLQQEVDQAVNAAGGIQNLTFKEFYQMTYVASCINETLRLWPVAPNGQFRKMEQDTMILGHLIPEGTTVIFPHFPVHRSKAIWGNDADQYNPDRKWHHEAFFPFGVSPRDCLGRNVAMLEMRVAMANIFYHFNVRLADPNAPVEDFSAATMYPKGGVNILLEKRNHE